LVSVRRGARLGPSRAFVVTSLTAIVFVACHGEADEARRADVARVSEAVRKLREAPNDAKRPLLLALQQTPCTGDDACTLRKSCSDAYDREVSAVEGIAAVRHATQSTGPVPPEATELLARSASEMKRAVLLTKGCADLEAATKRRYSIP
jgi:hypothetical protein